LLVAAVNQPVQSQSAPKPVATVELGAEMREMLRWLKEFIDTKDLQERVKLKTALEKFSDHTNGKLPILVDREAFALELGADAPDPYEEEVSLPPVPSRMPIGMALRIVLAQVGKGQATYVIRKSYVEITTRQATTAAYTLRATITFATFDQKPLPEILGNFADDNGIAINLDPNVGKKGLTPISATFRNCSLEEALVTVTEMAELKFVVYEHSIFVTAPERAVVLRKEEVKRAADRKELKFYPPPRLVPAS
jgi:hypothetical protein